MDRGVRISKLLSLALRHDPTALGLTVDQAGFAEVADVLGGLARAGWVIDAEELEEIVATSDKQRFALSPDGLRIRANQGHSIAVDLGLLRRDPPALLFHGTVDRFEESIRREGLRRGARTHVHLSADEATALAVGRRRRGAVIVLRVRAKELHDAGHALYRSDNGVWLTEAVPPEFIVP